MELKSELPRRLGQQRSGSARVEMRAVEIEKYEWNIEVGELQTEACHQRRLTDAAYPVNEKRRAWLIIGGEGPRKAAGKVGYGLPSPAQAPPCEMSPTYLLS